MHLTEDVLKKNSNMTVFKAPSLNARRDILVEEIPKLGAKAATKAIEEWGQPKSDITHVVFVNTGGSDLPGPDLCLTKILGLRPSVKRYMMYQQGCYAGAAAIRLAKDLAENNRGARVLVVCSETNGYLFHAPSVAHLGCLVGQAIFGDGAAAVIVGADPLDGVEEPLFQVVSAGQSIISDTSDSIVGNLGDEGLSFNILKNVPGIVSDNIEEILKEAIEPLGISDWNSLFWMVHPGGAAILDQIEKKLELQPEKLQVTRQVLSEYGNMQSASVLFILDQMRKKSANEGLKTTGEGLDWGVLCGIGPGITLETVVLRSVHT